MEAKFSQVAHLYLGCEIEDEEKPQGTTAVLDSIDTNGDCYYNYYDNETYQSDTDSVMCHVDDIKPVLKHLSDLSDGEAIELAKRFTDLWPVDTVFEAYKNTFDRWVVSWGNKPHQKFIIYPDELRPTTKQFLYLLSIKVDLFNLIETGQAINAKTV